MSLKKLIEEYISLSKKALPEYSCKFSRKDFTQHQLLVLVLLRVKLKKTYRNFKDLLEIIKHEELLGLKKIPNFTTIDKFFLRKKNCVFSLLLKLSSKSSGKVYAMDATGFDRRHSSRHYTKRCGMRIKSMKTTVIVDTDTFNAVAIHATASRKHDTKIAKEMLRKLKDPPDFMAMDKGYDDSALREMLKGMGTVPVIKFRGFTEEKKRMNEDIDGQVYGRRNMSESMNSTVKRKFCPYLSSKGFWRQVKEISIMFTLHNIERNLYILIGFLQSRNKCI